MVQRRSRSRTRDAGEPGDKAAQPVMKLQIEDADAGGGVVPFAQEPKTLDAIPVDTHADFLGCSDRVNALAVDTRGGRLVAASCDETARVWRIQSREPLGVLRHADVVNAVGVIMPPDRGGSSDGADDDKHSPKGIVAITGCEDGNVTVWNLDTCCVEYQLKPCYAAITALTVFHPEEDVFAVAALFDVFLLSCWGRCVLRKFPLRCDATSVCFSKEAQTLFVGQQDGCISCWDVAGAFIVRQLDEAKQQQQQQPPLDGSSSNRHHSVVRSTSVAVRALAVDHTQQGGGGAYLISATDNGIVAVWSTSTGDLLHVSSAHAGKPVMALCLITQRRKRRDGGGAARMQRAAADTSTNSHRVAGGSVAIAPRGVGGGVPNPSTLASPSKVISPKFHDATRTIFVSCGFDGTVHYHDLDTFAAVDGHGVYGYCMVPVQDADTNIWHLLVGDNQGRVKAFACANPMRDLDALVGR